ncbi:hypothetical protein EIP91_009217 [Steccherinum ochraceum]|uniref:Bromodomain associated domain-containing protein n=1 Tax=Steccherinum ochraceum TaxID=92696 RepID=A0A4R0RRT9_9APHY|nr:hypothetical protein EIP91_009217 [Steccherinum ochraceum]
METASKKILESATLTTLHAQQFSRSSTQAHLLLTDLLSRYVSLLSSTCAKYAEHAGRLSVSEQDAVAALGELGVGVDELTEYWETEGKEMARFGYTGRASKTPRRLEELDEMRAALAVGLRTDRDDAIPMAYLPFDPDAVLDDEVSELSDEELSSEEPGFGFGHDTDVSMINSPGSQAIGMDVDIPSRPLVQSPVEEQPPAARSEAPRAQSPLPPGIVTPPRSPLPKPPTPPPPAFPPSPISNPATPPPPSPSQPSISRRKRPRTTNWSPPPHVPAFLPPFPHASPESSPRATPALSLPEDAMSQTQPFANTLKLENPPSPIVPSAQPSAPGPAPASTSSSADYMSIVPYALSSLASQPAWHLPSRPHNIPSSTPPSQLPIPDTQPALFGAYHHILTHKPSGIPAPSTAGRYKVALALAAQNEDDTNPKWEPAPSLFGSSAPNVPRVATIGPTHPVPLGKEDGKGKEKEGAESAAEAKMPPMPTRPLPSADRVAPLVSSARPRIPQLAKHLLSNPVHNRTTRLTHPPVLLRGTTKLVYGQGVPAPWNSSAIPLAPPAVPQAGKPNGSKDTNGKDDPTSAAKLLPDARLFATWNWDQKSYKESLPAVRRGRMGSVAGNVHIGAVPNGISRRDR